MVKIYISFKGNCDEAIRIYEKAFHSTIQNLIYYRDVPYGDPTDYHILHSEMNIEGTTFIFSDYLEPMTTGDNFSILLEVDSDDKVRNYYNGLSEGAETAIDIGPMEVPGESYSLYVNFKDRFNINWIIQCKKL